MSNSIEKSIKDRIKAIATAQKTTFNIIWDSVVLERWLARLAASAHKGHFIFKGALCLTQYIEIHRETRDLDFLVRGITANLETIKTAVSEIGAIDLGDGFTFTDLNARILDHEHMNYPGYGCPFSESA